jgi:hypothetical protein
MKRWILPVSIAGLFLFLVLSMNINSAAKENGRREISNGHMVKPVNNVDVSAKKNQLRRDADFGNIPLYFIPNKGQVNERAKFYAKTSRYTLWMTKQGLVFDSVKAHSTERRAQSKRLKTSIPQSSKIERDVSRLLFRNANKNPEIVPLELTEYKVNYFTGNDKSKWKTGISTSKAVLYKDCIRISI